MLKNQRTGSYISGIFWCLFGAFCAAAGYTAVTGQHIGIAVVLFVMTCIAFLFSQHQDIKYINRAARNLERR